MKYIPEPFKIKTVSYTHLDVYKRQSVFVVSNSLRLRGFQPTYAA